MMIYLTYIIMTGPTNTGTLQHVLHVHQHTCLGPCVMLWQKYPNVQSELYNRVIDLMSRSADSSVKSIMLHETWFSEKSQAH